MIWALFKLIWGNEEANSGNTIVEILRKSRREERYMVQWEGERKSNFSISVAKIPKKKLISISVLPKWCLFQYLRAFSSRVLKILAFSF